MKKEEDEQPEKQHTRNLSERQAWLAMNEAGGCSLDKSLSIYLSIYLYLYVPTYLSLYICAYLSICLYTNIHNIYWSLLRVGSRSSHAMARGIFFRSQGGGYTILVLSW